MSENNLMNRAGLNIQDCGQKESSITSEFNEPMIPREKRKIIWDHMELIKTELHNMSGIVQNPLVITDEILEDWSNKRKLLMLKLSTVEKEIYEACNAKLPLE